MQHPIKLLHHIIVKEGTHYLVPILIDQLHIEQHARPLGRPELDHLPLLRNPRLNQPGMHICVQVSDPIHVLLHEFVHKDGWLLEGGHFFGLLDLKGFDLGEALAVVVDFKVDGFADFIGEVGLLLAEFFEDDHGFSLDVLLLKFGDGDDVKSFEVKIHEFELVVDLLLDKRQDLGESV